ncbi:MAG: hypothetical protein J6Q07_06330 [Alistipes sp.]|nr:hypothetical protein [Alistipes sp.]
MSKIKSALENILYNRNITRVRFRYADKDLQMKASHRAFKKCSPEQKERIRAFWSKYGVKSQDLGWFDYYNTVVPNCENLELYVPHGLYFARVDAALTVPYAAKTLDDKNFYDLLFYDIHQPKTICRVEDGVLLDGNYQLITRDEAVKLCQAAGYVIIKPSVNSCGGNGIKFWKSGEDSVEALVDILNANRRYIVSEVVSQSREISRVHASSLNTIRIMSLMHNNKVYILSSILRMGVGGAKVDNATAGGIFCGINDDGTLKDVAHNTRGDIFYEHPQTGPFNQFHIPNFEKCKELVERCAPRLSRISRLCSWDICLDENDEPMLIEANLTFGGIEIHQVTNGPIFGDMTEEVLDSIFKA